MYAKSYMVSEFDLNQPINLQNEPVKDSVTWGAKTPYEWINPRIYGLDQAKNSKV